MKTRVCSSRLKFKRGYIIHIKFEKVIEMNGSESGICILKRELCSESSRHARRVPQARAHKPTARKLPPPQKHTSSRCVAPAVQPPHTRALSALNSGDTARAQASRHVAPVTGGGHGGGSWHWPDRLAEQLVR